MPNFGQILNDMTAPQKELVLSKDLDQDLRKIADKVIAGERITFDEGVILYKKGELAFVGALANFIRERKHGDNTYFNKILKNNIDYLTGN